MTPTTDTPVIAYCRVSTEEQGDTGAGLDAQEHAIRAACEARGWQLTEIVREVASGKTLARRPALRDLLERMDSGEGPRHLVVGSIDRLARSMLDWSTILERSQRKDWGLVLLNPSIDFSDYMGRAMANMLMTFAELEREMISDRTKKALAQRRREGVTLGRPRAMPADTIGVLTDLRAKGLSIRKIADELNERGIRGPQGGRWHPRNTYLAVKHYVEAK